MAAILAILLAAAIAGIGYYSSQNAASKGDSDTSSVAITGMDGTEAGVASFSGAISGSTSDSTQTSSITR